VLIASLVLVVMGLAPVAARAAAAASADSAARVRLPAAGDSVAHAPLPEVRAFAPADSAAGRSGSSVRGAAPADTTAGHPGPSVGSAAPTDSTAGRSRRPRGREGALGTSESGSALARPGLFDAPRWVMLRSLLLPGWGQFTNHAWIKGVMLGGADAYLRVRAVSDEHRIRQMQPGVDLAQSQFSLATTLVNEAQDALDAAKQSGDPNLIQAAQDSLNAAISIQAAASARYNALVGPYNSLLNGQISRLWLLGGVLVYAMVDAYVDAHFRHFKVEFEHDPALPGGKPASGKSRLFLRWIF
jgi:hypothetical protein